MKELFVFWAWSKFIRNFLLFDTEWIVMSQHLVSIDMQSDGMEQKLFFSFQIYG